MALIRSDHDILLSSRRQITHACLCWTVGPVKLENMIRTESLMDVRDVLNLYGLTQAPNRDSSYQTSRRETETTEPAKYAGSKASRSTD